jgi:hypothetical protein
MVAHGNSSDGVRKQPLQAIGEFMFTVIARSHLILATAAALTITSIGPAQAQQDRAGGQEQPRNGAPAKVSRLGAINVPYDHFQWYVDHGYDLIGRVSGCPEESLKEVHTVLQTNGIEHFNFGLGWVRISEMGLDKVPPERRGIKRGPGANKYTNLDYVCGGWDQQYRFRGEKTAGAITNQIYNGIIFEDYLNRSLCYCSGCEAEYRQDTGKTGFPELVYDTPHYEDTVAFDPILIAWDQERIARNFRIMAAPIHEAGKKVAVAGVCRWIVGPEAAAAVDKVMFYTYYAGRRLPANYMRNWKYWHDNIIPDNLWVIFGYFREYHACHTRVMLANLPDGVNLAFWACQRQITDTSTREDALYAVDVVRSSLVPIRIAVYDSSATRVYRGQQQASSGEAQIAKATLGLKRLGLDAKVVSSLDSLERFDLLYLEDVECLGQAEVDRIRQAGIPVLATGVTGLRDETGRLWGDISANLPRAEGKDKVLHLPAPLSLSDDRLNIENQEMQLDHPWFEFMFETRSTQRGDLSLERPYTDPRFFRGIRRYSLSLIPSRVYGEFLGDTLISHHDGTPIAFSSETRLPMIVYSADAKQVYSTIKFSDYVNVHDLTECGYGYQMRQFCFLQIIDALTLPRRGVQVEPYLMTAVRATETGHFLTIGNVYDESRTVTLTLSREPKAVRVNHVAHEGWEGRRIALPPIAPKDAVQIHVDY